MNNKEVPSFCWFKITRACLALRATRSLQASGDGGALLYIKSQRLFS